MGTLIYGADGSNITFEDRLLAHLQIAIITKLRRNEPHTLSWETPSYEGSGRSTVWLHPAVPMQFKFSGSKKPVINRVWVEQLLHSANSTGGLQVIPEPRPTNAVEGSEQSPSTTQATIPAARLTRSSSTPAGAPAAAPVAAPAAASGARRTRAAVTA
jgi:hypothetical protein